MINGGPFLTSTFNRHQEVHSMEEDQKKKIIRNWLGRKVYLKIVNKKTCSPIIEWQGEGKLKNFVDPFLILDIEVPPVAPEMNVRHVVRPWQGKNVKIPLAAIIIENETDPKRVISVDRKVWVQPK